ncbi:1421_t:CDS:2 [Acaulospora colombiana]|uniref:1421_t:CDS:1 n=1 Tax=Acaulospora colombiana TaxID=27376 RepID=A0ACA9MNG8_9GLOM|nr:1421_t:CDS:2 [Acaulospora colombiana]
MAYSNPECIVPALPFLMTSYQSSEEDERRVKHAMQLWMNRVSKSPVLCHDEELRSFIETDFAFVPATKPRKQSGSFRFKFSSDIKDNDLKLVQAKSIVHKLEGHFLETAKAAQKMARSRKGLSVYNNEFGVKSLALGTIEIHPSLSMYFNILLLGKSFQAIGELQQSQAVSEAATVGDFFSYYAANAHETLTNRLRIISEHDNAVKSTIIDEALEDLDEAKNYEQTLDARAKRVTNNLHLELKVYEENRNQDFLVAIKEYVKKQITYEKQLLKELENLKPDISAITKTNMKVHAFGEEEITPRVVAEKLSIMAG